MRIVILGGSASATPELADALADWPGGVERRPALEIVLHGRSADRLDLVAAEMRSPGGSARRCPGRQSAPRRTSPPRSRAPTSCSMRCASAGSRPGSSTSRIPQRHGCPGEETMGPGGLANALRTVPVVRAFWATRRGRRTGGSAHQPHQPVGHRGGGPRAGVRLARSSRCATPRSSSATGSPSAWACRRPRFACATRA